ncbi:hypothetical protein [Natronobeatus ordinarius]|uniref:hypothetical protein n=1 Tax=Natronobeatus ordinarius TaxID=2963433 RepID=UPI0020CEC131|nr:hypothetical protein [Natronobeatus ordinarius]
MTDRSTGPTRRQLLGAVAGVGAVGATVGVTAAHLHDRDGGAITIQAGAVSIDVDCGACFEADGSIGFEFGDLEPGGDVRREPFALSVEENPARLWVKTACPPAVDPLGDALQVRLLLERTDGEAQLFPAVDDAFGTLGSLKDEFSDGIRLDDRLDGPCLSSEDELSLVLEYVLPEDADWTADLRTELRFEVFAEQCRHVSEDDVGDPFAEATGACPELECPACEPLGKLDVVGDRLEPGTYAFDELYGEFEADGHVYELGVLTATNKDDGGSEETICASFRLLKDGIELNAPPICTVDVAGGPSREPGPATETYEIDPPLTRTTEELCTENGIAAISNVTVSVCPDGDDDGGADS